MPRRSLSLVIVHVVWSSYRRQRVLPPFFDATLGDMVGGICTRHDASLLAMGCASDHVHVLTRLHPAVTLASLVQAMKGATAHEVNRETRLVTGLRWQAGYWAESVSPADAGPLSVYIRAQRTHHDDSHLAEHWLHEA